MVQKPPRSGSKLDQMIQDALKGSTVKPIQRDSSSGSGGGPLDSINKFFGSICIGCRPERAPLKDIKIGILNRPEKAPLGFKNPSNPNDKADICNKKCENTGAGENVICRMNKFVARCPGASENTDIAPHDQDCNNYLGLGGLADGLCVGGKGINKGKDEWFIPVVVGGVLIIGLIIAMK